jgi:glycosyltransferase involved in cell wall biosynthesis
MKIIVIYVGDIMYCPPALSVVEILSKLRHEVVVCTICTDLSKIEKQYENLKNVKIEYINNDYASDMSLVSKLLRMIKIKRKLWGIIDKYYDDNTFLWVISEVSVKHLGEKLLYQRRYILHMLELIEGIYYISGVPTFKLNCTKYANNALAVIEAEYNRAHITKAWWNLNELPYVIPNKPYSSIEFVKNSNITTSDSLKELIDSLKGKKIILYQGNISKERPLEEYIKAVDELGEEYAFVIMINGENPYPNLKVNNYYCIPFVAPPYHLEVTSHAYIGILSYVPIRNSYSLLNTLYCAPNKIWEYSKFGIPMIGNDLPALQNLFLQNRCGICLNELTKDNIIKAIKEISENYASYNKASSEFYSSVDMEKIVEQILTDSTGRV